MDASHFLRYLHTALLSAQKGFIEPDPAIARVVLAVEMELQKGHFINHGTRQCPKCGRKFASGPKLYQECSMDFGGCGSWVRKEEGYEKGPKQIRCSVGNYRDVGWPGRVCYHVQPDC